MNNINILEVFNRMNNKILECKLELYKNNLN